MKFNVNQFINSRDEWHYFWTGVAAGWTGGVGLTVVAVCG